MSEWRIVKIDQTRYCDSAWLASHGVTACGIYAVVDVSRRIHICSLTASAEVWPAVAYADRVDPDKDPDGEVEIEIMRSEEPCDYYDMSVALKLPFRSASHLVPDREEDEDEDAYYRRIVDVLVESLNANHPGF